jgi:D-alanine-D-alanine ligase
VWILFRDFENNHFITVYKYINRIKAVEKLTRVLVAMGGTSAEREVSLRSGQAVSIALQEAGYEVSTLDINRQSLMDIVNINPDVVFIALHGKNGEDGTIQGFLDFINIPYTGSGLATSAICMNKILTKKILKYHNLPTPSYKIVDKRELDDQNLVDRLIADLGLPVVVKPATQGSSIGVTIVKKEQELFSVLNQTFELDDEILVEEYIPGIEVTASVIGNEKPLVLPLIEITSQNEFYDYESKYTKGMCDHIIPARIDAAAYQKILKLSEDTYKWLKCRGFARIDYMLQDGFTPYILEVNTVPGMTEMSLVPDAARAQGISFPQLVDKIVKLALEK